DRSAGIWDKVSLFRTGPVTLGDPHVACKVPGVRSPDGPQAPVQLTVSVNLKNNTETSITGILACTLDGELARTDVRLGPQEHKLVALRLELYSPRLWWPNGMGEPYLYEATLTFCVADQVSDQRCFNVGLREIGVTTAELDGRPSRVFSVN